MATENTTNHVVNVTDNGSTDKLITKIETLLKRVEAVQSAGSKFSMGTAAAAGPMPAGPTVSPIMGGTAGSRAAAQTVRPGGLDTRQYNALRGSAGVTGASARDFAKQSEGLGGLVRLYATYAANVFAVSAAFGALSRAMDTTNMISSMDRLGASVGKSLGSISKNVVAASDGAISLKEAMSAVAKSSAAGIAGKDIERLAVVAKNASLSLGISMPDALNRLSRGVTKLEPELLDELGLFTKIGPATDAYARSLGKSATSLTDYEKRQAFLNAVLKEGEEKFAVLGDAVNANPYDKLVASLQNLAQNGLELINKVLGPLINLLSQSPVALAAAIGSIGIALVKQALPAFGQFKEGFKKSADEALAIAIQRSEDAREARKRIERLATKDFEAEADAALAAVTKQENKIAELRKQGQFDPKGATAAALAKDTADVGGRDFKKMEEERRKYLKEGNAQAAEAVKGTIESFKAYQTLEEQVTKVRMAEEQRTKQLEAGNSALAGNIEVANKAQESADKRKLIASAAYNRDLIGATDAWKLFNAEIDSSDLKLSKIDKGMLKIRGGFAIATSVAASFGAAIASALNIIGTVVAVFSVLDVLLSNNAKELNKFSSAIDASEESAANAKRTIALLYETSAGNTRSIEGINALANAFTEISRNAKQANIDAKIAIDSMGIYEKIVNGLKGIVKLDVQTKSAETLAKQTQQAIELAKAAGMGGQVESNIKNVLKIDDTTFETLKNKFLELGVDGVKPFIKLLGDTESKLGDLNLKLQTFDKAVDATFKAYQEAVQSSLNNDPLFKLGQQLGETAISMMEVKEKGVDALTAAFKKFSDNPEKAAIFGKTFAESLVGLTPAFNTTIGDLKKLEIELAKTEKQLAEFDAAATESVRATVIPNTSLMAGYSDDAIRQLQAEATNPANRNVLIERRDQLKADIQLKLDSNSIKNAVKIFGDGIGEAFKKSAELIDASLKNAEVLNALKIQRADLQGLTGTRRVQEEARIAKAEIGVRQKTLDTQIEVMTAQDTLTISIDRLRAAVDANTAQLSGDRTAQTNAVNDRNRSEALSFVREAVMTEMKKNPSGSFQTLPFQDLSKTAIEKYGLDDESAKKLAADVFRLRTRLAQQFQAKRDLAAEGAVVDKNQAYGMIGARLEETQKSLALENQSKQVQLQKLGILSSILGVADKNLIIQQNSLEQDILSNKQKQEINEQQAQINRAIESKNKAEQKYQESILKIIQARHGLENDTKAAQDRQKLLQVDLDIITRTYERQKALNDLEYAKVTAMYNTQSAQLGAYAKLSSTSEEVLANATYGLEISRADAEAAKQKLDIDIQTSKKIDELNKRKATAAAGDVAAIAEEIQLAQDLQTTNKNRIDAETKGKKEILGINKQIALVESEIAKRAREFELEQSKAQTKYAQESLALEKRKMSVSALGEIGGPETTFTASITGKYLEDQQRIAEFNESNRKITDATNQENLNANTRINALIEERTGLQTRLDELGKSTRTLTTAETLELVQGAQQLRDNKKLQEDIAVELQRKVNLSEEEKKRLVAQNEQRKYQIELDVIRFKLAEDIRQVNLQAALETSKREIKNSEKLGELELQRSKIDVYAQNNPSAESYLALIRSINDEESARLQTQIQINNISAQTTSAIAIADAQKAANARLLADKKITAQQQIDADAAITAGLQKQLEINTNAVLNAQTQLEFKLKALEVTKEQNLQQAKYNELLGITNNLATSLKDTFTMFGDTFKKIGEGLGSAVTSLVESSIRQEKFAKQRADDEEKLQQLKKKGIALQNTDEYGDDIIKNKQEQVALEKKMANDKYRNTRAEITENQQAASSIKNLFKEKTAAYKAFAILEKALAVQKLLLDAQKLASEFGLTAATLTNSGTRISATVAEAEVNSVAGVIKAIAGLPFPLNLAAGAATAAAMASLMNKIGGNGPGFTSGAENIGTGTTFGDNTKRSETLKQSQEVLNNTDPILMRNSSQMLKHLRSIDYNIASLGVALVRNLGGSDIAGGQLGIQAGTTATGGNIGRIAGAAGLGAAAGFGTSALMSSIGFGAAGGMLGGAASSALLDFVIPGLGSLLGAVIGSKAFKTSVGIQGQGIQVGPQSLADIRSQGFQGQVYADVETKKRAFGIAYSTRQSTVTGALDADISRTFKQIFVNAGDALISASSVLDKNLSEITSKVDGFVINLGKLNLQGLDTEAQQKLFENVVGAELDRLVTEVYPEIVNFIKVGEGAGTTLARMTYGIESANNALEILGIQAIKYTDILNKQGDVGGEIVRQSILAVETQDLIKRVIENADGSAQDIVELYTQLDTLRDRLIDLGISQNFLTEKVLIAAGGTDAFSDSLEKFYDRFTTDEFKTALETSKATAVFNTLNIAVPKTREAFFTLFQTLSSTAPEAAGSLLKVIDSIDTMYKSMDKAASERKDLQRKLDELLLSSTQLRELDILSLDASNRALQRQIWAQQDLQTAAKALQTRLADVTKTITTQLSSLKDYRQSLMVGDKSTLTSIEQYQQAKQNLSELYRTATDKTATDEVRNVALGKIQGASDQVLGLSRQLYASGAQYSTDQATVIGILDATSADLEARKTDAQLQLDQLEGSNTFLEKIQANTKSTADYIAEFLAAQSVYNVAANQPGASRASFAVGTNYVPQDMTADIHRGERIIPAADNVTLMASNQEMVAEIRQLNQRIVNLEQAIVEGNMINAAATDRNTDAIVVAIESSTDTTLQFNRLQKKGTIK